MRSKDFDFVSLLGKSFRRRGGTLFTRPARGPLAGRACKGLACAQALVGAFVALVPPSPLWGEDFRVELFPSQRVESIALRAGSTPVRICSLSRAQPCLSLMPLETARCVAGGEILRCRASDLAEPFRSASLVSASPFQLEARLATPAGSALVRAVELRAAEVSRIAGGLRVTSRLDLESYVTGVLAGEASTLRNPSALRALAVAARTWAIRQRGRHRLQGFDFCSLTHCQVFRAHVESMGELRLAATLTARQVLMYHGQLVDVYFSANCGGVTEAAADVWPDRHAPYLKSAPDPYCLAGNPALWRRALSLQTVAAILRQDLGVRLDGPLGDLVIGSRDVSGRVRTLRASGASEPFIDANQFRYALNRRLGWNTLKSNLYSLEHQRDLLMFTGRGLGHGVGLCQAGAEQMGRMGIPYQTILATYFPGTTLAHLTPPETDPVVSSEHFELVFPAGQQPWASETLQALENLRRELGERAEALPAKVRVETWETTEQFVRASGQLGWAAAANDGRSIALQPLGNLKRKGILQSTLRHELAHLAVHPLRAPQVPQWFEEGLVLYLTGEQVAGVTPSSFDGRKLEENISNPRSEAAMKAAYARALSCVRAIARKRGEAALWQLLEHPAADDLRALRGKPQ